MSEQTPNSSEDLPGAEPSMEDILASIRKIISEDEPVALESPEDAQPVEIVSAQPQSDADLDLPDLLPENLSEKLDSQGDSVDLNIDDVLAGLDDDLVSFDSGVEVQSPKDDLVSLDDIEISDIFDSPSVVSETSTLDSLKPSFDPVDSEISELNSDDDILAFLDADIPLVSDTPDVLQGSAVEVDAKDVVPETIIVSDDTEMDSLLDEILMTPDAEIEEYAPEYEDEPAVDAAKLMAQEEQSDLDLVKSLMADLADDPSIDEINEVEEVSAVEQTASVEDVAVVEETAVVEEIAAFEEIGAFEAETEEDLDSLLAIPDVEESVDVVADALSTDEAPLAEASAEVEDDILDDIFDMTLEDELQAHPEDLAVEDIASLDDVAALEQENIIENAADFEFAAESEIEVAASDVETVEVDELPSLAEIAAAAEADAVAVETAASPAPMAAALGAAAAGAGIAAMGAISAKADTPDPEIETNVAQTVETETVEVETVEIETVTAETIIETPTKSIPSQETPMPVKAVKTDTILDDVTESATAGAFAELNQVVEDKAIFNERGPRIGDLVQDALRPMLKEWLDANLKGIVERAVTKEVKRISSGK